MLASSYTPDIASARHASEVGSWKIEKLERPEVHYCLASIFFCLDQGVVKFTANQMKRSISQPFSKLTNLFQVNFLILKIYFCALKKINH